MFDCINILEAPDNETIARVSAELGARATIDIGTLSAIPIFELVEKNGIKRKEKAPPLLF